MDKDFIKHNLQAMAQSILEVEDATNRIKNSICAIIGYMEADDSFSNLQTQLLGNGYQEIVSENLITEIKEMIIELNVKGSIRQRENGLIELRTQAFGSIYGRTKAEIEQKLTNKIKEAKKENKIHKTAQLLSDFYKENYLPYKLNQNRKENTIKGIESNFKYIIENDFNKPITAYKPQEIERFLYSISKTRKRQVVQGLLNNMFDRALALSLVKANPCAPIEKMQHTQEQGTAFSFEEQQDFFTKLFESTALSHCEKCYFVFIYLTGARREEALKTAIYDVDMKNKVLAIRGVKTDGSDRSIPLTERVEKLLESIDVVDTDNYFNLSYDSVGKKFREVYSKHKIHDLRHTFGTIQICVEQINTKTVSLWLGHSTIDTTLHTYTHPEQLDKATFLRGDLTENEKNAIYKSKYEAILQLIDGFLKQAYPKCTQKT